MDPHLGDILEPLQRGELVLVVSDREDGRDANDPLPGSSGYLALAAERATPEALARMLRLADAPPVFTTTRDRLEQLGIVLGPFVEPDPDGLPEQARPSDEEDAAALALAAKHFAGSDADAARSALEGHDVRCIDWGGVVNCPRHFEAAVDLARLSGLAPAAVVARLRGNAAAPESARTSDLPKIRIGALVEHRRARASASLRRHGPRIRLPTRHGEFSLQAYEDVLTGMVHLALCTGELRDPVLTRVHSECLTGDLFGSLRCDCGPQLDLALSRIVQEGGGTLLYLRQEGRGIGLINKLRTYAIQDEGFDTVEANERLGFEADLRDYSLAAEMLVDLGVHAIRLLTNNPRKVRGLKKHGIRVADRVPLVIEPSLENTAYLHAKREKLGHWLP